MKYKKTIKILISLFAVISLSMTSFAAVVSDNDGSAFITKSEFDSLKNDFQSQLDSYNTGIDSKIDSAISSYLAGIKTEKVDKLTLDTKTNYSFPLVMMSSTDLWNNPKSAYYNLVRNRVRYSKYDYYSFVATGGAGNLNAATYISDSDYTSPVVPAGNWNGNIIYGFLISNGREIKGKNAPLYYIKTSSNTRKIGSTNYKVFDIDSYGLGYQYLDYVPTYSVTNSQNWGHFSASSNGFYAYCGVLGLTNAGRADPLSNKTTWTEAQYLSTGSGWSNKAQYDTKVPSYIGTKVALNAIPEWYGHGSGGTTLNSYSIDSSSFVWSKQNVKTMLYAGTANVPSQLQNRFGFEPDFSDGTSTLVECVDIQQTGFGNGWAYNTGSALQTTGRFYARTCTYMPPMKAIAYNGYSGTTSTLPSFSAVPATCIRYYDEENKVHYMDEGMFLKNIKRDGIVDFDVKFGTNSGTKSLNFYVSKFPFSRENLKTKLATFKVDKGSTEYTSKTFSTGTKYHITVENMKSGDQIYILWEPATSGQYVTLTEFSNFELTTND